MKRLFNEGAPRLLAALAGLAIAAPASAEIPRMAQPLVSSISQSQPWCDDFQRGWDEAKRRGVPMVVFITSDHCVYCDAMKRDTWCDVSVASRLRRDFVPIRLHRDRDSALLSRIIIPAYPTTLIASPQGKVMAHRVGYQPPDRMHQLFSEVQQQRSMRR